MKPQNIDRSSGIWDMVAANVLFAFIGFFVLESKVGATDAALFRCVFGGLFLGVYCWFSGFFREEYFTPSRLIPMALCGLFMAVMWVALFEAYAMTSISVATLMFSTQPFITLIVGSLVFREQLTVQNIFWTLLAFLGVCLISGLSSSSFSGEYSTGVMYAVGAAFLYAITSLISRDLKEVKTQTQVFVQVVVAGLVLLLIVDRERLSQMNFNTESMAWLLALGVLSTAVAYILLYSAYCKLKMSQLAVLSFIYPCVAVIIDYFAYGTILAPMQWLGIALVVIASIAILPGEAAYIINQPKPPRREPIKSTFFAKFNPAAAATPLITRELPGLKLSFKDKADSDDMQLISIERYKS